MHVANKGLGVGLEILLCSQHNRTLTCQRLCEMLIIVFLENFFIYIMASVFVSVNEPIISYYWYCPQFVRTTESFP